MTSTISKTRASLEQALAAGGPPGEHTRRIADAIDARILALRDDVFVCRYCGRKVDFLKPYHSDTRGLWHWDCTPPLAGEADAGIRTPRRPGSPGEAGPERGDPRYPDQWLIFRDKPAMAFTSYDRAREDFLSDGDYELQAIGYVWVGKLEAAKRELAEVKVALETEAGAARALARARAILEKDLADERAEREKMQLKARVYGAIAAKYHNALAKLTGTPEDLGIRDAAFRWRVSGESNGVPPDALAVMDGVLRATSRIATLEAALRALHNGVFVFLNDDEKDADWMAARCGEAMATLTGASPPVEQWSIGRTSSGFVGSVIPTGKAICRDCGRELDEHKSVTCCPLQGAPKGGEERTP